MTTCGGAEGCCAILLTRDELDALVVSLYSATFYDDFPLAQRLLEVLREHPGHDFDKNYLAEYRVLHGAE